MQKSLPINIDLILSCSTQIGGHIKPIDMINDINNKKFKCLKSIDNSITFEYDDTYNIQNTNESTYLGKGSYTGVFAIKQITESLQLPRNNNINETLILRITEEPFNLNKYLSDNNIINNIPYAYYYGKITINNITSYNYLITKKYNIFTDENIKILSIQNKKLILYDLVSCLSILEQHKYIINDLKTANIGYDENFRVILIDYDEITIVMSDSPEYLNTYEPAFVFILYYSLDKYYDEKYLKDNFNKPAIKSKLSVNGFVDIILQLFFTIIIKNITNDITNTNNTIKYIVNDITVIPKIYNLYNGGITIFDSYTKKKYSLKTCLSNTGRTHSYLNLLDTEIINNYMNCLKFYTNDMRLSDKLIFIMKQLLNIDYLKIPTYFQIEWMLNEFENFNKNSPLYNQYLNKIRLNPNVDIEIEHILKLNINKNNNNNNNNNNIINNNNNNINNVNNVNNINNANKDIQTEKYNNSSIENHIQKKIKQNGGTNKKYYITNIKH